MALRTYILVASLLGGAVLPACEPAPECANGLECVDVGRGEGGKGGRRASPGKGGSTGKGGGGTSSTGGSGGSPSAGGSSPRGGGGGGGDPFFQAGGGGGATKAGSGGVSSKGGAGGTASQGGGSGAPAQAGSPGTAGTTAGTSGEAGSGATPPPDPTDPWEEGRVLCVKQINEYRATVSLPPLDRWTDAEKCADAQALNDAKSGNPHEGFQKIGGCGQGQNECPGYASIPGGLLQCLGQMWAEGPTADGSWDVPHGHHMNMRGDWTLNGYTVNFTRVACGFGQVDGGGVWGVQNFN